MSGFLTPVSVGQDNRRDEGPEVQQNDEPARDHLDPHTEHALIHGDVPIIEPVLITVRKNRCVVHERIFSGGSSTYLESSAPEMVCQLVNTRPKYMAAMAKVKWKKV